ncbi:Hypothetical Protein FCC1311_005819 [Hondaea fermentalgiana]|uniref:TIR domain-containing protein n=1 Tax=Hondaea fermentalgiana TaxID=2315210 RepID=A0A2R5GWG5_9STRA|nr:Hypothetical Protein FCC1311_005819 [Hondaea fermentalgiana]|eukprot:GBG33003.1 Hypothetical Protein FCC1311_005819 [Hondaea fermentalgiana]
MRYNRELQNAGLKVDFAVMRKRGIATLSLLRFLWNDEEVDYLRAFMHETMLMSDWNFSEKSLPRNRQNEPLYLAIIYFGLSVFALEQTQDKIWIRVERDSKKPASTLKTLVSMFRGARDAVFRDLPWELLLQLPRDAFILVSYDDVVRARTSGVDSVLSVSTKVVNVGDFEPFFQDGSLKEDEHDTGHVERESQGNLAEDAMRRGIRASKCYLLFLSKTVFEGAVRMELETALQEEKPILLVHESDPNRVGFDTFSKYIETAPDAAKHLFRESESMPFQRRLYLAEAFYGELIARIDAI